MTFFGLFYGYCIFCGFGDNDDLRKRIFTVLYDKIEHILALNPNLLK